MQKQHKIWALACSALVAVAACDQVGDPTGLALKVAPVAKALSIPVPIAGPNQVYVCKDGPFANYTYTAVAGDPLHTTINSGSPFNLVGSPEKPGNDCKLVATGDGTKLQSLNVTEIASSRTGVVCLRVDIYKYTGGVLQPVTNVPCPSVLAFPFGPDNGYTLVFVNILGPGGFDVDGTAGVGPPASRDECKDGGWAKFDFPRTFKNQGDCIQYYNTGK